MNFEFLDKKRDEEDLRELDEKNKITQEMVCQYMGVSTDILGKTRRLVLTYFFQ